MFILLYDPYFKLQVSDVASNFFIDVTTACFPLKTFKNNSTMKTLLPNRGTSVGPHRLHSTVHWLPYKFHCRPQKPSGSQNCTTGFYSGSNASTAAPQLPQCLNGSHSGYTASTVVPGFSQWLYLLPQQSHWLPQHPSPVAFTVALLAFTAAPMAST